MAIREILGANLLSIGFSATAARVMVATVGVAVTIVVANGFISPLRAAPAEPTVSFENQVLPIFEVHCIACHSPGGVGEISSGMDLTSYKDLRMGSLRGVAITPFHADLSPIMRYLKTNWQSKDPNALKMPPLGPQLSAKDLQTISDWIDQGAKNN